MNSVLLVGDLGTRDPGTTSLLRTITRSIGDRKAIVTSSDPARTRARTGIDAVHSTDTAALWRSLREADGVVLIDGALKTGRSRLDRGRGVRTPALPLCLAARATGTPVALFTVAADHLPTRPARMRARALIQVADLVVLRDRASAQNLAEAGAPVPFRIGADVTWAALDDPDRHDTDDGLQDGGPRDEIIVVLDAAQARPGTAARLGAALAQVARDRGLGVRLIAWQLARAGADDLDLARAVGAHVPGAIVDVPPSDLGQMRRLATRAAVVVTGRLHVLHAAAAAGAPALAFTAQDELMLLAADLGQRALEPDAGADAIGDRLRVALDGPAPYPDVVAERTQTAERSLRLLRLLLGRGATDDDLQGIALPLQPAPEVLR